MHPLAFYDVDTCLFTDAPVSRMWVRFSQIKKLHRELQTEFPVPELPPNKWFGCKSQQDAESRRAQLHTYFCKLLGSERVRLCDPLSSFCRPRLYLDLCVVGVAEIQKMRLVTDFYRMNPSNLRCPLTPVAEVEDCYPERANLPVDVIVDHTLLQIRSIEVRHINLQRLEELIAALEVKDGLIFAYNEEQPETLEPVRILRHMLSIDSVLVALDCAPEGSRSAYPVYTHSDLATVYEHLLKDCMRRQRLL